VSTPCCVIGRGRSLTCRTLRAHICTTRFLSKEKTEILERTAYIPSCGLPRVVDAMYLLCTYPCVRTVAAFFTAQRFKYCTGIRLVKNATGMQRQEGVRTIANSLHLVAAKFWVVGARIIGRVVQCGFALACHRESSRYKPHKSLQASTTSQFNIHLSELDKFVSVSTYFASVSSESVRGNHEMDAVKILLAVNAKASTPSALQTCRQMLNSVRARL
jgi:hypothetical protein